MYKAVLPAIGFSLIAAAPVLDAKPGSQSAAEPISVNAAGGTVRFSLISPAPAAEPEEPSSSDELAQPAMASPGPAEPLNAADALSGDTAEASATPQPEEAEATPDTDNTREAAAPPPASTPSGHGMTAIGDSVMLDIEPYLQERLPGIYIDGRIGRQMSQALPLIEQLRGDSLLGSRVVVELGTNGAFTKRQLDALLDALADREQVVLVTTRVPRPWESAVNDALAEAADSHKNVTLIDWYDASSDHDDYFERDGVHLNGKGSRVYAELVADVLLSPAK